MNRYFIGFLVSVGLIVLIIILIFSGGKPSKPVVTPATLPSYAASNAEVRMTIDGPISAVQTHNSVTVTVSQNSAVFNLIKGYNNDVISSKIYPNTENSYKAFLYSLYFAGFSKGNNSPSLSNYVGVCPLGDRYVFELIQNGNDIQRYWATNCGGTKTYSGNLTESIDLFKSQIPDFNSLTQHAIIQY